MIALFCTVAAQLFCVEFVCAWILYSSFLPQSKDKNNRLTRTSNCDNVSEWLFASRWPCDKLETYPGCNPALVPRQLGWTPAPLRPDYRRSGDRNLADG